MKPRLRRGPAPGQPENRPTMIPPTIPVINPAAGGAPDAIAVPMHSGNATRNTTNDANRSCLIVVEFIRFFAALFPALVAVVELVVGLVGPADRF